MTTCTNPNNGQIVATMTGNICEENFIQQYTSMIQNGTIQQQHNNAIQQLGCDYTPINFKTQILCTPNCLNLGFCPP